MDTINKETEIKIKISKERKFLILAKWPFSFSRPCFSDADFRRCL